ncbi:MAG: hypothetical protein JOZ51_02305, partial [Chloroflexi bacterium]|nr:hypothetical protein [Chloroflexota bacterium]
MSRIIRRQGLIIIHIVLTLLTLSACASSAPAVSETPVANVSPAAQATQTAPTVESTTSDGLRPIATTDCETLRVALAEQLATPLAQANTPFSDPISGKSGTACQLTARGTGQDFGSFVEVADKIRATLIEQGWTEDQAYLADGPTGTGAGFHKNSALAVMLVEWSPAPEVQCPADQPISACEVPPAQQIFDISL